MKRQQPAKLSKTDLWFQKAFAAHNAGNVEEAKALYLKIIEKTPSDMESWYLLGTACSQLEQYEDAERYLRKAVALKPDHPEANNNLGLTLRRMGKKEDAAAAFRKAIQLSPDYADAHSNLGGVLEEMERYEEAVPHFRKAIALKPDLYDSFYGLGLCLRRLDCFDEAARCFQTVLRYRPDYAEAHSDLGTIYKTWGRTADAISCFRKALELKPDFYLAQHNLGAALEQAGQYDEADAAYERAMTLDPENLITRWNRAFFYLQQGILDKGWDAHEERFNPKLAITLNRFPYPEWDGGPLDGKTILIYAEQGLGDEILFASCIPDVLAMAGHCVIECEPRLANLYRRAFPQATVVGAPRDNIGWLLDVPPIQVQCAVGSLPRFLRRSLDRFPSTPGYLSPDPDRVAYWRARLQQFGDGLKIGICWRSSMNKGERKKFYSELTQWDAIFAVPGVTFFNLQYDDCADELREAEQKFGVPVHVFPEVDLRNDIDETAALTGAMDMVISAATAAAEIAGSIGVPVFQIDPYGAQWPSLGTNYMPWHPRTRIFAQQTEGDWDTPLALLGAALAERASGIESTCRIVELADGTAIAVSESFEDSTAYVVQEQLGWSDPEYLTFIGMAAPGARIVDIGAGAGAWVLPMARKATGGQAWAFAESATDASLLLRSRSRNKLDHMMKITIADQAFSLDAELDRLGLAGVDLVRVAATCCNSALFDRAKAFLQLNSPLLMIGLAAGSAPDREVVAILERQGYRFHHAVPGLRLLAPLVPENLDPSACNVFACKSDRADSLAVAGVLASGIGVVGSMPGVDSGYWQDFLAGKPYAAAMQAAWCDGPSQPEGWEINWMGLHLYALAQDPRRSAQDRIACLATAADVLNALVQERATVPRLVSLARVLIDLGNRSVALRLLKQLCELIGKGAVPSEGEPFLALCDAAAAQQPGDRLVDWMICNVLAMTETLRAPSTFHTGREALALLEGVTASGFGTPLVERQVTSIRRRYADRAPQ